MFDRTVRGGIRDAAVALSGRHGAVTRQAEQAGCSRQAVYQHARKLEQRPGDEPVVQPRPGIDPGPRRSPHRSPFWECLKPDHARPIVRYSGASEVPASGRGTTQLCSAAEAVDVPDR